MLVAVGRRPRTDGWGLETPDARHERPRRADRRPVPHVDAQRLGDRRRDRRADAGAPRDGAGRDGGRDHRRPAPALHAGGDPRRVLHRPRGGRRRPHAGGGSASRTRLHQRDVPVRRQRPRDDARIGRRLRARRRAPRQPPDRRLAGGGPRRVGAERGIRPLDRDGRAARGHRRHDPRPPDARRSGAGSGAARARARAARLSATRRGSPDRAGRALGAGGDRLRGNVAGRPRPLEVVAAKSAVGG